MSELTYLLIRLGLLLLVWLAVFGVVFAIRSDLFGPRVRAMPKPAGSAPSTPRPAPPAPAAARGDRPARAILFLEGPLAGRQLMLTDDALTIGRASDSGLILTDDYTSNYHARLQKQGNDWYLEDVGSTNGTFLGDQQVTTPVKVPLDTPIRIGSTIMELRS